MSGGNGGIGLAARGLEGQTEKDPQKIGQQIATETLNKIKPKMTEEEATKMKSDGGVDQEEFKTMLAKGGLKPSSLSTQKFNELDTNKNGKLEESEMKSDTEGEGEDYDFWDWLGTTVSNVIAAVAGAAAGAFLG